MLLSAKDAIARHVQWKITLQTAVALREPLSPEKLAQIRQHQLCPIGRWLSSSAVLEQRARPEFAALVHSHIVFHKAMELVAEHLAQSDWVEAAKAMGTDSSYARAAQALALAIISFDRVCHMVIPA